MIFSNYAMRREGLLSQIYEDKVAGIWDDTLFPILQDMIAYGADSLSGDTLNDWVDAALDAAMVTLSAAAPELAPGIIAIREAVEAPVKEGAEKARQAVYDWAVGGKEDDCKRMIDTFKHASAASFRDLECLNKV